MDSQTWNRTAVCWGHDLSNVIYGAKMKAKVSYNSRIFCLIRDVHQYSDRYLDRVSTKVSVHMSTDYRSTDMRPTLNGSSLSADSRSLFGRYIADISPTEHRHTTDVSSDLVLHVVDTSVDCCEIWMFRGFSLSKCFLSVKSQRDANISWKLFASFSRLFSVSTLTRARFTRFSPHVRESMTVLDCGFHTVDSRFRVLDSGFQLSGFRISKRAGLQFFFVCVFDSGFWLLAGFRILRSGMRIPLHGAKFCYKVCCVKSRRQNILGFHFHLPSDCAILEQ